MIDIKFNVDFASQPSDDVDVWLLDLSEFSAKPHAEFAELVSSEELIRAQEFKINSAHFLATRAFLRQVLSLYTGIAAHDLLFARSEHGKPFLSNCASVHFNLSHCNTLAVLAVSKHGELGIDIETAGRRDFMKIAKRFFHESEFNALQNRPITERENLFYKYWTLKEAFFKATGGGISTGLDRIIFQFDQENISASLDAALNQQQRDWRFHQQLIAQDTLVALAVDSHHALKIQWLYGNPVVARG
ncbi:4'-phosphopantetheinyl transferase family protein [Cellvibrio zantedeschiae]|uniref:4'-phosphopantetheinyl transferase family protein n=1 Tax=Cellvibrio zantedeschiae TaxID=1237077 RepID=UPI0016768617|nr:4'-phosphopantetheinyl transferase superfamily protein [Cellvibrio zantedeschiae]